MHKQRGMEGARRGGIYMQQEYELNVYSIPLPPRSDYMSNTSE